MHPSELTGLTLTKKESGLVALAEGAGAMTGADLAATAGARSGAGTGPST